MRGVRRWWVLRLRAAGAIVDFDVNTIAINLDNFVAWTHCGSEGEGGVIRVPVLSRHDGTEV